MQSCEREKQHKILEITFTFIVDFSAMNNGISSIENKKRFLEWLIEYG